MCENPQYTKTITESTDEQYGYTTYTCSQMDTPILTITHYINPI